MVSPSSKAAAHRQNEVVHTYQDSDVSVVLRIDRQQRIHIATSTSRLKLETINQTALKALRELYADRDVMKLYRGNHPKPFDYAEQRLKRWTEQANNGDPYHGLMVLRPSDNAIMGVAILGHCEDPGVAEIARFLFKEHWNQGYGTEIASAMAKNLAPALHGAGFHLRGRPLTAIRGAIEPKNMLAYRSLLRAGFRKISSPKKFGDDKTIFVFKIDKEISLSSVVHKCENFCDE